MPVGEKESRREKQKSSKQKFRGNSSDEGSVVWKEIIREEFKIVLKFSKEDGGCS